MSKLAEHLNRFVRPSSSVLAAASLAAASLLAPSAARADLSGPGAAGRDPTPPPAARPEGVVRVHIDTDMPLVQLHRDAGSTAAAVPGGIAIISASELLCRAPCDQVIDGSRGELFRLKEGDSWVGPKFRLHDRTGDVVLKANLHSPGNKGVKVGGIVVTAVGGASMLFGAIQLILNAAALPSIEYDSEGYPIEGPAEDVLGGPAVGGALIGAGAAAVIGGIVMIVAGRRTYDVGVPEQARATSTPRPMVAAAAPAARLAPRQTMRAPVIGFRF